MKYLVFFNIVLTIIIGFGLLYLLDIEHTSTNDAFTLVAKDLRSVIDRQRSIAKYQKCAMVDGEMEYEGGDFCFVGKKDVYKWDDNYFGWLFYSTNP